MRPQAVNLVLALLLFVLNVALNWPLFLPGESPYRGSIEGGYIGMARFVAAYPNPWGWNPLQYCGLPTQFMYVPLLPYASAALSWASGLSAETSYRLITAFLACLGPATVFAFVLYFTRSRGSALCAALIYTFFSPLYGLIRQIDHDRGFVQLPWRLHVFAKYGEGPHNAGLAVFPLALAAAWAAGMGRRDWQLLLAAILMAFVTLTNWVAALALGLGCCLLLFSAIGAPDTRGFRVWRVLAAAVLAWLLSAFWLTPSFIRTIAFNWPADAFNYKLQQAQWALLAGWVIGIILLRVVLWRLRRSFYETFVTLACFAYGWLVVFHYSEGIDTLPESRRYALEFELFLTLALLAWFRAALNTGNRVRQFAAIACAMLMLVAGAGQARKYATQSRAKWKPVAPEETAEHNIGQWLTAQKPSGRVLASGGLRFRLNSNFDLQQVGGSFESGLRNRTPVNFAYQIRTGIGSAPGAEAEDALRQLHALGVEYVVIHGPQSREYYRDFKNPAKFEHVLQRAHADRGDVVYRVPFRGISHLVRRDEFPAGALPGLLGPYVASMDDPSRPALQARWRHPTELEVSGPIPEGMAPSVRVSYDPGWTALQDGVPAKVQKGELGFIKVIAKPSQHSQIRLIYTGTAEQRIMAAISGLTWLCALTWLLLTGLRTPSRIHTGGSLPRRN